MGGCASTCTGPFDRYPKKPAFIREHSVSWTFRSQAFTPSNISDGAFKALQ